MDSTDKQVARAYKAIARATVTVDVHLEGSVPVFVVPKAISGMELEVDSRLRRARVVLRKHDH